MKEHNQLPVTNNSWDRERGRDDFRLSMIHKEYSLSWEAQDFGKLSISLPSALQLEAKFKKKKPDNENRSWKNKNKKKFYIAGKTCISILLYF